MRLAAQVQKRLTVKSLVSVQLFAGCVMYGSDAQRVLLHELMCGRKEAAQELLGWRVKVHMLPAVIWKRRVLMTILMNEPLLWQPYYVGPAC